MIEWPKRVKVNERWWKIDYVVPRATKTAPQKGGRCIYEKHLLVVNPTVPKKRRLQILIHEVLHAVFPFLDEESVEAGEAAIWDAIKTFITFKG